MSHFKTDTQLTLISRIPVMLLSFIAVVFLTRLLGPEGNGVYTFTMAAVNLFITLIGFQLEGALPVFLAKEKGKVSQIFSTITLLGFISLLVFSILLATIVFFIPGGQKWVIPETQSVRFFIIFIFVTFILRRSSALIQASLRGMFKFKAFNLLMIIQQLIPALTYGSLLVLTLVNSRHFPMITCFKVILLVETFILAIGLFIIWQSKAITFSKNYKPFIRPVFQFSLKNQLSSVGHFINKRIDVWFVQFYQGTAMLGQYGLASQISNFISEAMTPFNQVMIPYVAESTPDQHKIFVERTARLNMTIAFVAAIIIITTSWLFVPLLFGTAFAASIPAMQILAIGIVFISQRLVFTGYFKAINELKYPVRAAWTGVFITIVLDILLIPRWGIVGAAIATTFAFGVSSTYLVMMAKRKLGFSIIEILLVRKSDLKWIFSRQK